MVPSLPWLEYVVFGGSMIASVLIGVYFALTDSDQKTTDGYLFAGKNMGLLPVTVSLVCSHISGVTLIGVPTEVYSYGTQYLVSGLGYIIVGLLSLYVFLPVFYPLQLPSLYEYLELRFDATVRRLVSIFFAIYMVFQTPLVAYGPAIILNQVSGVDILLAAFVLTGVCVLYTTMGGLKAVLWADTLQGGVMLGATCLVTGFGLSQVGGLAATFQAASQGERLELFIMDPDPRVRVSFWSCLIGVTTVITYLSGVHPSCVQRYVALPTFEKAKRSVIWYVIGCSIFFFVSGFLGLVIYAKYKDCDPKAAGEIRQTDQIISYFLLDSVGHIPGLVGLFLAGMVSAALSTMSTNLNTVSGTIYSDLIEPIVGTGVSEVKATWTMRSLVVILGVLSLALLLVIDRLAAIIELANIVLGLSSGSIFGIFLLGLFFPNSNTLGCVSGAVSGLLVVTWVMIEARLAVADGRIVYPVKPTSVDQCPGNVTLPLTPERKGDVFPLFEISVFYYTTLGCLLTVTVGVVVSWLSGGRGKEPVPAELLSPLVRPHRQTQLSSTTTAPITAPPRHPAVSYTSLPLTALQPITANGETK